MNQKKEHKDFYNFAWNYLSNNTPENINLESYMSPVQCESMKDVYKQLVFSAQNRVMSNSVIGYRIGNIENLSNILKEFDVNEVLRTYNNPDQLFDALASAFDFDETERIKKREHKKEKIIIDDETKKTYKTTSKTIYNKTLWYQYCISILAGAKFLSQFSDKKDFFNFVDKFKEDEKGRALPALPLLISKEIFGFREALSCDFLKEIGFIDFGKPDVHVIKILKQCGFSEQETSESREEYEMMKKIQEIAKNAGVTAYRFDKVLWLISSGRYYKDNIKTKSLKKAFINAYKNR